MPESFNFLEARVVLREQGLDAVAQKLEALESKFQRVKDLFRSGFGDSRASTGGANAAADAITRANSVSEALARTQERLNDLVEEELNTRRRIPQASGRALDSESEESFRRTAAAIRRTTSELKFLNSEQARAGATGPEAARRQVRSLSRIPEFVRRLQRELRAAVNSGDDAAATQINRQLTARLSLLQRLEARKREEVALQRSATVASRESAAAAKEADAATRSALGARRRLLQEQVGATLGSIPSTGLGRSQRKAIVDEFNRINSRARALDKSAAAAARSGDFDSSAKSLDKYEELIVKANSSLDRQLRISKSLLQVEAQLSAERRRGNNANPNTLSGRAEVSTTALERVRSFTDSIRELERQGKAALFSFNRFRRETDQTAIQLLRVSRAIGAARLAWASLGAAINVAVSSARFALVSFRSLTVAVGSGLANAARSATSALLSIPYKGATTGLGLIRSAINGLLAPTRGVIRAFSIFSRSILPFLSFGVLANSLRTSIKEYSDFGGAVGRALNIAAKSTRDFIDQNTALFNEVKLQVRALARESLFTPTQVADTLLQLTKGGLTDIDAALAALNPTINLGIIANTDSKDAAQLVNVLINQFDIAADSATELEGKLDSLVSKIARATTIAPTNVVDFRIALEQAGQIASQANIDVAEALTLLVGAFQGVPAASKVGTGLSNAILQLLQPTAKGVETLNNLLQRNNQNINEFLRPNLQEFRGPGSLLALFAALEDAGAGAIDLLTLFGKRTRAISGLADIPLSEFIANLDLINKAGRENFAETFAESIENATLEGKLRLLNSALTDLKLGIVDTFLNVGLDTVIRRITFNVNELTRSISDTAKFDSAIAAVLDTFRELGTIVGELVAPVGRFLTILNASLIAGAVGAIQRAFDRLRDPINAAAITINEFLRQVTGVPDALFSWSRALEVVALAFANTETVFDILLNRIQAGAIRTGLALRDALRAQLEVDTSVSSQLRDAVRAAFDNSKAFLVDFVQIFADLLVGAVSISLQKLAGSSNNPLIRLLVPEGQSAYVDAAREIRELEAQAFFSQRRLQGLSERINALGAGTANFLVRARERADALRGSPAVEQYRAEAVELQKLQSRIAGLQGSLASLESAEGSELLSRFDGQIAALKERARNTLGQVGIDVNFDATNTLRELDAELAKTLEALEKPTDAQKEQVSQLRDQLEAVQQINNEIQKRPETDVEFRVRFLGLEEFGKLINQGADLTDQKVNNTALSGNTFALRSVSRELKSVASALRAAASGVGVAGAVVSDSPSPEVPLHIVAPLGAF